MKIGTKSILFGVHQFVLHPIQVAVSYSKLYGVPTDPRIWVAFVVHDWGYWGCDDMDGPGGREHPQLGYKIMAKLFGHDWGQWTRCHSREYCKNHGLVPSTLCIADKMAICVLPVWAYLAFAKVTGELDEYMRQGAERFGKTPRAWLRGLRTYMRGWCAAHKSTARKHPSYRPTNAYP